ncbi:MULTISPECIES: HvfC/BufC N-terminal domain-containing protein [unclassified Agarivorans]|uniref:HvfC/BufC N-terminal domain-containing protein n=1 Tax=unclassified Agarivorans TaxID=2636026 RepID=UPI0026E263E1|nr:MULTISPECIES: DNA-binding domain-containing protein [unclassified Agarivorans]MDO6686070.1 DNA-binding domain-containing protein [Agarivorans sp. 3_MG-2023]MDO6713792.1 DNA-binding domain-containing protein [Agarivorans sp. 2_MG-2023]
MLKQLQSRFAESLNRENNLLGNDLAANTLSAEESIQIYQNNYVLSLSEALRATYPTVEKLVGEDYFKHCAKAFILQHGHNQGDLNLFGEGFNTFLQAQEALNALPYLPDIALLDWHIEQTAGQAIPTSTFSIADLQSITAEQLGNAVLHLAPHQSLLASEFPLFTIYQMVQHDQVEQVELEQHDHILLTKQANFEVQIEQVSATAFAFLKHSQQGLPLGQLPADCLAELEPLLGDAIQHQRISHFSFASPIGESHDANL